MYNVYVESYGCSANQNDSEIIKGLLARNGFNLTDEKFADIIILNTCVVKEPTLKRIESRIKHFSSKKLIVAGCMPEVLAGRIKELAPTASMISTHHIKEISKVVRNAIEGKKTEIIGKRNEVKLCLPRISQNKIIGIVQIAQGCVNQCAYCLVKHVKGNLFSYPQELILKDVKNLLNAGAKEIWLTSQDNAAYGLDRGKHKLPELLEKICNLKGKFFIRLGMMNPSSLLPICDEVIECYKNKKMFKFLHLPVQSGSNKILKAMGRNYKINDFIKIVKKFCHEFSAITIATDIIVGFPGESENDFQKTLKLIKKIQPDIVNISKFWPMPGTQAANMKQKRLDAETIKKRAITLMKLHNQIALEKNKTFESQNFKILIDKRGHASSWLGRNESYKQVVVKSEKNLLGKFLDVEIEKATGHYLLGKLTK